jgi:NAD(P)-dependent dehydrogenase (short-subunit alcohol dehydrogenase family)
MTDRLAGKIAIITGAGSGIGLASAELFAREGASVVVTDINEPAGRAVAEKMGAAAIFLPLDTRQESQWEAVLEETQARFGRLDILVNNAGVPTCELIEETSLARWRSVMAINLDGVFLGVKLGIGAMKKTGGGSIVNISSVAGLVGTPRTATYSASKAGVMLLSKCAALECAELGYNIRVNSVHPGIIETPLAAQVFEKLGNGDAAAGRKLLVDMHPIGRMGRIEDVANGVLYLACDESAFVTGSGLVIDGGMTAH